MRPSFIVLEGLDGCGKSTLATSLAERIGASCLTTPPSSLREVRAVIDEAFPRGSPSATLFYAAGVVEVAREVERRMARGESVVVDRYWFSTRAYARVLGCDLALPEVEALLVPATMTVFVRTSREVRAERLALRGRVLPHDRMTLDPAVDGALRQAFAELLRGPITGRLVELDGTQPTDALVSRVLDCL